MQYNGLTSQFLKQWLEARGWTESKLAKESGVSRPVISDQLWSGKRRIAVKHLNSYTSLMNHQDRSKSVALWLRDNIDQEVLRDVLDAAGEDLDLDVKKFVPALKDEDRRAIAWLTRQIARDGEINEWWKGVRPWLGYHPRRTAAKRRR